MVWLWASLKEKWDGSGIWVFWIRCSVFAELIDHLCISLGIVLNADYKIAEEGCCY